MVGVRRRCQKRGLARTGRSRVIELAPRSATDRGVTLGRGLWRRQPVEELGGELAQASAGLARVFGPVGARARGEASRGLQGRHAQDWLVEALVLRVLSQPLLVLGVL